MQLSILLITYNSEDKIIDCLRSLVRNYQEQFKKKDFEIVLLDNKSEDNTLKKVNEFLKNNPFIPHHIIKSNTNLGFAKGVNTAAENAQGDNLFILNPDTVVKNAGLLDMVEYIKKHEKVGVMGGRLITSSGVAEKSTGRDFGLLHIILLSFSLDNLLGMRSAPTRIQKVDWVSGGCMLVKRQLFHDINGFDEKYFMYVEDADLCKRVRDLGKYVVYFPVLEVEHTSHASGSKSYAIRNIYAGFTRYSHKFHGQRSQYLVQFLLTAKAKTLVVASSLLGKKDTYDTYSRILLKK